MNNTLAWLLVGLMIVALCGCATNHPPKHQPLRTTSSDWSDNQRESMEACVIAVMTVLPVDSSSKSLEQAFQKCLISMGATI